MRSRWIAWITLALVIGAAAYAARGWRPLRDLGRLIERTVSPGTPREQYVRRLEDAALLDTALGRDFITQGQAATGSPTTVSLPVDESIDVDASIARAVGLAFPLERGEQLTISVALPDARVFVDLFGPDAPTGDATPVASAEDRSTAITFEVTRSGTYVARVQPELLRGGSMRVQLRTGPSLHFPVSGAGLGSMQSLFGDPRDAGRREHEGVDIFASRGTHVLAAADGFVTRVGENRLGGQVVWVWSPGRGLLFYYAHLHEQRVSAGQRVRPGDVIGTVGNTGNARTTPPHLHFGIYEPGAGAIDPAPFIRPADGDP